MNELKLIRKAFMFIMPFIIILVLSLILFLSVSYGGDSSIIAGNIFSLPLESGANFVITSEFGYRIDPIDHNKKFHSGIDLGAKSGTKIVASEDGKVIKIGYNKNGLGNYIYIEHNFDNTKFYTIYGHILDKSIVVKEGQEVKKGDIIGLVGSTGRSTGNHLHFTIMKDKLSFEKKYLIDPIYVIKGLK